MQGLLNPPADLREVGDEEATSRHLTLLVHHGEPTGLIEAFSKGETVVATSTAKERLEAEKAWMKAHAAKYWIPDDHRLASRLQGYAPRLLFVRGTPPTTLPTVSIVGTRHPDEYGIEVTKHLAFCLAKAGICVVSGGALGVDRIAHEAALEAKGSTLVILAGGLANPHPPSHRSLFEDILSSGGAIITEYPVFSPSSRWHFPERNRLLAAMVDAVIVTQAGENSGALITAEWAMRTGVPLFAVPADIWFHTSVGTVSLLRRGAKPLSEPSDLAEVPALEGLRHLKLPWPQRAHRIFASWAPSPSEEKVSIPNSPLVEALQRGPADVDKLCEITGLEAKKVQAELTALEVEGAVVRLPGGRYRLASSPPSPKR